MSHSFRPTKTIWGPHSSNFLSSEMVERIISILAETWTIICPELTRVGNDMTQVFIKHGSIFLDQLEEATLESLLVCVMDEADLDISGGLGEQGLRALLNNMLSLASEWRKWLDEDGGLTFLID